MSMLERAVEVVAPVDVMIRVEIMVHIGVCAVVQPGRLVVQPAVAIAHDRCIAVEAVEAHVLGLVDGLRAGRAARVHQVARDLGLAVDDDRLAHERVEVDPVPFAARCDLDAVMDEALAVQAPRDVGLLDGLDGALLEHARAYASEHVVGRVPLEDHRVDAGAREELAEQQARGSCPDDRDLRPHALSCALVRRAVWRAARAVSIDDTRRPHVQE